MQQMEFIEFGDSTFESQLPSGGLKFLNEIGRSREENAPPMFYQRQSDGGGQMCFATARPAEQQKVCPFPEPGIACGKGHDVGLADHWHGRKIEAVERFAGIM